MHPPHQDLREDAPQHRGQADRPEILRLLRPRHLRQEDYASMFPALGQGQLTSQQLSEILRNAVPLILREKVSKAFVCGAIQASADPRGRRCQGRRVHGGPQVVADAVVRGGALGTQISYHKTGRDL